MTDVVLQMVEGVGKLEESLHLAGRETEWLGSLQKSYAKRLDDTSARWQLFVNNGRANLLAMGDKVLPVFGRILDRFSEMMTKARSNGSLEGMGNLVAKAFEGIDVVVENVGRHFDFLAKNWGKIEPYLTAIGAAFLLLAARLWPVGAVLAGLGLAIDEVLGYMEGADTVIGPFIESLARFLGTEPEKVAELLGGIGKAVAGFLGGAIGVAMFASAISSLGRALMVITGAQAAIGILSRIAGIGWGSAAAGAGAAAAGAAGAAGVGAAAGAAGAGAAGAGAAGATGGAAAGAGAAGAAGAAGGATRTAASVASRVGAAATSAGILGLLEYKFSEMTERTAGFMREFEKRIGDREKTPTEQVLTETPTGAMGSVISADIALKLVQLQSTISSWFSPLEGRLDAIQSRVDSAFATTAGGSSDQNTLGMKAAFNNFAANLQAMRGGMPAGTTTMTFSPVDNRAFPVSVSAPVSVNVTQAAQAPAAVGNAISAAVQAGANAMPPARISGGSAP